MSGRPIARTLAEARVGDLIWVQPDRWHRRSHPIEVWPVRKVGRQYLFAGVSTHEHTWDRFRIEDGRQSTRDGAGEVLQAFGAVEREADAWSELARSMAERLRECRDIEVLKAVAFSMGIEGPPSYATAPEEGRAA